MPVVSIRVSKISPGRPRVGVLIARSPGPRPSAFQAGHIPKSPYNVRASGAVAGRRRLPLVVAVAITVAVSSAQVVRGQADPDPQGLSVPEDRKRGRP